MSTKAAVGVIALLLVAGGAAYYYTKSAPTVEPQVNTNTPAQNTEAQPGKFEGTFAQMAARQGSWRCTLDSQTAQAVSSGVTYISNGKVRGEFSSTVEGYGTVEGHMLADGQYVYTWSSMMREGFKMPMTAANQGGAQTSGGGMDANSSYSYDCQPWTPEPSRFELPAGVTFRSI